MDVVVPVYNGVRHVRSCLVSIGRWTDPARARLIVVDDASTRFERGELDAFGKSIWQGELLILRNEINEGFLRSANRGMRAGKSASIVLVNSDVLVGPEWLDGLVRCLWSEDDIGLVTALSSHSTVTSLRAYYGSDYLAVSRAVRRHTVCSRPDIMLAVGFCLAGRRSLLHDLGYFDEAYGRGYFEESDLSLRALEQGFRTVADDATYVHHHGWGSFDDAERIELLRTNGAVFGARWGEEAHGLLRQAVKKTKPFGDLEERVAEHLRDSAQVAPKRRLPARASRIEARSAVERGAVSVPVQRTPTYLRQRLADWQAIADNPGGRSSARKLKDVLVLADDLTVEPESAALLQLVDLLSESGIDISVAVSGYFDPGLFAEPCRVRPFVLAGPDELLDVVPAHRLVLATSPAAVYDALLLRQRDGSRIAGWFANQIAPRPLTWPEEGLALAWSPSLVSAHIGPGTGWATDIGRTHRVDVGVCLDTFQSRGEQGRSREVLVPVDLRSPASEILEVGATIRQLEGAGVEVRVYGDELPGIDVPRTPFLVQDAEADLLGSVAALVEVAAFRGQDRLRLRCAATSTSLVASAPLGPQCPLEPDQLLVAPRGDQQRLVEVVTGLLEGGDHESSERVKSALERARSRSIRDEAAALGTICVELME